MIDRKKFFDAIRFNPFPGKLTKLQVEGITAILDEFDRRKWEDLRWLAYMLATTKWETNHTMQPIKELDNKARTYLRSKKYWPWIGRGYVQLTWKRNYEAFQEEVLKLFGKDIIANPDEAMHPQVAAYVMFEGMLRGTFTSKKLENYFNAKVTDWYNARRIINGTDRAAEIASIAKHFYADLVEANQMESA
jgi:putative chitinase